MDKKVEPKQGLHTVDGRAASKTVEELEILRHEAHKHLQAKAWDEAYSAFNELLQDNQEDVDALLGFALALDRLGDYLKMYEIARSASQIDPSSALALACQASQPCLLNGRIVPRRCQCSRSSLTARWVS